MAHLEALDRHYARLTDAELQELAASDPEGFRPGALDLLRAELDRRGLDREAQVVVADALPGGSSPATGESGAAADARSQSSPYAGFAVRLAARAIDQTYLALVAFPVVVVGTVLLVATDAIFGSSSLAPIEDQQPRVLWLQLGLGLMGWLAYFTICEGFGGRTLGKAMIGLIVVRSDLTPAGPLAALRRTLLLLADGLVLGAPAALSMHHSRTRQRLGDRSADTVVMWRKHLTPRGGLVLPRLPLVVTVASITYAGLLLAATLASLLG